MKLNFPRERPFTRATFQPVSNKTRSFKSRTVLIKKDDAKKKKKRATGRIHGDVLHLGRAGNCAAYYLKNGYEPADGEEEETKGRRRKKGATISHRAFLLRASPLKAVRYDFLSDAKTDKPKRENEREREREKRENEERKGKK